MESLLSDCYEIPFVGQDFRGWVPPALLEKAERVAQLRERGYTPLSVRTGIGDAESEKGACGSTGRTNRAIRST
ncbi:hypothetical protein WI95_31815 [Burkholderia contaminans]|nr:hypothetical protein WI95_31815 [Burkholderia contaminans]TCW73927.1 hypothetical protein C5O79_00305 [Burkholderia sp. SRS-25]